MLRFIVSLLLFSQIHAIFLGKFCTVVYVNDISLGFLMLINERETIPLLEQIRLYHPEATGLSKIEQDMYTFSVCYPHLDSKCGVVLKVPIPIHKFQSDKLLEFYLVSDETLEARIENGRYVLRSCREIHETSLMERMKSYFSWTTDVKS